MHDLKPGDFFGIFPGFQREQGTLETAQGLAQTLALPDHPATGKGIQFKRLLSFVHLHISLPFMMSCVWTRKTTKKAKILPLNSHFGICHQPRFRFQVGYTPVFFSGARKEGNSQGKGSSEQWTGKNLIYNKSPAICPYIPLKIAIMENAIKQEHNFNNIHNLNIFQFSVPESSKGVKFVPLNHEKQTWGLKFDNLGGSRYIRCA